MDVHGHSGILHSSYDRVPLTKDRSIDQAGSIRVWAARPIMAKTTPNVQFTASQNTHHQGLESLHGPLEAHAILATMAVAVAVGGGLHCCPGAVHGACQQ